MSGVEGRYRGQEYSQANPDWHAEDSPWKADQILAGLGDWRPGSVCEVGCGVGGVLGALRDRLPDATLVGYDIAPEAVDVARALEDHRLSFRLADPSDDEERFDLMLIVDVIEHVADPIGFMAAVRPKAERTVLHVPLDLSVQTVLRPGVLMGRRESVGHIHYFNPEAALAAIRDAGYAVRDVRYTPVFEVAGDTAIARAGRAVRRRLPTMASVRWLGGYSLLVVADNEVAAGPPATA
jgi:SAM-dependent methyltransferase